MPPMRNVIDSSSGLIVLNVNKFNRKDEMVQRNAMRNTSNQYLKVRGTVRRVFSSLSLLLLSISFPSSFLLGLHLNFTC